MHFVDYIKERVKEMEYDLKANLLVLAKYFGLLGIWWYVLKLGVPFILKRLDQAGVFMAARVQVREYVVVVVESLFLLCLVILSSLCFMFDRNYVLLGSLFFYGIIAGSFVRHLRNNNPQLFSLVQWSKSNIKIKNYYANRFKLICDQLPELIYLWGCTVVTLQIFRLPWPGEFYYAGFLILPVYLNVWIYCSTGFRMQTDGSVIYGRKWITYTIITCLTLYIGYIDYQTVVLDSKTLTLDSIGLFSILITLGIFGALERFFKFWNDDYRSYSHGAH